MRHVIVTLVLVLALATAVTWSAPAPAAASAGSVACTLTGLVSGVLGKACTLATHAGTVVGAGEQLLGGHLGGALSALTGGGSGGVARTAATAAGLTALAVAVVAGSRYLLGATAHVIGATTRPNLASTWFSSAYWRMAAISALLTVPFLCGAAVQAILRADLSLLVRAAFGYLPLAMLAIAIAAPLTTLLLSASDEMSALVAGASGHAGAAFLGRAGSVGILASISTRTIFVTFFVALVTAMATLTLWVELLVRDAAVYVIVLMLPLLFAAMVWPARRIWAIRAIELLVALILSKFVIVAVLTLGGAALGHALTPGPASILAGATLVMLAAFSPWAVMRLLPLQELAGSAAAGLSPSRELIPPGRQADGATDAAEGARRLKARMAAPEPEPGAGAQPAPTDPLGVDPEPEPGVDPEPEPGVDPEPEPDERPELPRSTAAPGATAAPEPTTAPGDQAPTPPAKGQAPDEPPPGDPRGPLPAPFRPTDVWRTVDLEELAVGHDGEGLLLDLSDPVDPPDLPSPPDPVDPPDQPAA